MTAVIPQNNAPLLVTEAAAAKLNELLTAEDQPNLGLRIAVKPGGCSGYKYDVFFDTASDDTDLVSVQSNFRVVIDPDSATRLAGATLDYQDRGLHGGGFAIDNPNQTRTCGCGQSFT